MTAPENRPKLKLAVYWGSACGGCCVSILDTHEKLLDIASAAEIVLWPIAFDYKYSDIEALPDQSIDVTLFNGAVRNTENKHIAELLRRKTKTLVAYGSCAYMGGIPGLANFHSGEEIFRRVYFETESTRNETQAVPLTEFEADEGTLRIPGFFNDVYPLDRVVEVDYYIPGCPPRSERLLEVFSLIVSGGPLPRRVRSSGQMKRRTVTNASEKRQITKS